MKIDFNFYIRENSPGRSRNEKKSLKEMLFSIDNFITTTGESLWTRDYLSQKVYEYANFILEEPWHECEKLILYSPKYAYLYARNVLKSRWEEAEQTIYLEKLYAYYYAKYVLKDRLPEYVEKKFLKIHSYDSGNSYGYESQYAYLYAKYVLKTRFKKAENKIAKSDYYVDYALCVMKKRWEKIEERIIKDIYKKHKGINDPKVNCGYWAGLGSNAYKTIDDVPLDKIRPNLYYVNKYIKVLKDKEIKSFLNKAKILSFSGDIALQRGAQMFLRSLEN
jgi:hypothetical protein